eukprot:g11096.t1
MTSHVLCFLALVVFAPGPRAALASEDLAEYLKTRAAFLKHEDALVDGAGTNLTEELGAPEVKQRLVDRFLPSTYFPRVRALIENTTLYKVLRQMPKGGALHLHVSASFSMTWVVNQGLDLPGCYVFWPNTTSADDPPLGSLAFYNATQEKKAGYFPAKELILGLPARLALALPLPAAKKCGSLLKGEALPELSMWAEVFDESVSRWRALGVPSGGPSSVWIFAMGTGGDLWDVTARYGRWSNMLEARGSLAKVWTELLEASRCGAAALDVYQKQIQKMQVRHPELTVKLIGTSIRMRSPQVIAEDLAFALEVKAQRPDLLVGWDAPGEEDAGHPTLDYARQLLELKKQAKAGLELPLMLHDGESDWSTMNTVDAVLLGAKRLGHGFNIVRHPLLMEKVREDGVAIEVCPISNQVLRYLSDLRIHPGLQMLKMGLPVTISSDDPGIWGARGLSHDFWEVAVAWQLNTRALKTLARNSRLGIAYSGLAPKEKTEALQRWQRNWQSFMARWRESNTLAPEEVREPVPVDVLPRASRSPRSPSPRKVVSRSPEARRQLSRSPEMDQWSEAQAREARRIEEERRQLQLLKETQEKRRKQENERRKNLGGVFALSADDFEEEEKAKVQNTSEERKEKAQLPRVRTSTRPKDRDRDERALLDDAPGTRITVKGTHWSSSSVLQPAASSFAPHFVRVLRLLGLGAVGLSSVRSSARVSRKRSQDDKECSRVPGVASNGVPLVEVVKVSDEVGFEGDNLRFVRVLRTNSVAVRESAGSGGAVYAVSCRANHSCKPNAALCVQEDGTMHLKALRDLHPGEAVFVSYIGEGDLLRPRPHRQEQLGHWGFTCNCERCGAAEDTRGFRCSCGSGVMKYEASEVGPGHRWGPCNCCKAVLPEETLLGTEELWQEHVFSLRPERTKHLSQIALAMYDGLVDQAAETESIVPALDGHWISAKLARLAAEELIRQERVQDARAPWICGSHMHQPHNVQDVQAACTRVCPSDWYPGASTLSTWRSLESQGLRAPDGVPPSVPLGRAGPLQGRSGLRLRAVQAPFCADLRADPPSADVVRMDVRSRGELEGMSEAKLKQLAMDVQSRSRSRPLE